MILLITPSARSRECAQAVEAATGRPTHLASTLQDVGGKLRSQEYAAVIVDQFLWEVEPDESDRRLQHLGTAIPAYVNFGISGIERVVREIRTAPTGGTKKSGLRARLPSGRCGANLKESVTALLLVCALALSVPGVPTPAAEKIKVMHDLACEIRTHLGVSA